MKVAINRKNGGFDISQTAILKCIEYGMVCEDQVEEGHAYQGDFIYNKKALDGEQYRIANDNKEFRINPILIRVIEELKDDVNCRWSLIKIVDIPFEDVNGWYISNYAGLERVEENRRIWD